MARPKNLGLSYIPIDIDIFEDPKIVGLQIELGKEGIVIWLQLLTEIYRQGWFLDWDESLNKILGFKYRVDPELIIKTITVALKVGLIDGKEFEEREILTSNGIKKRYCQIKRISMEGLTPPISHKEKKEKKSKVNKSKVKDSATHSGVYRNKPELTGINSGKLPTVGNYTDFNESDFTWPPNWTDINRKSVREWVEYKRDLKCPILLKSYQSAINKFSTRPSDFGRLVERAIMNGWQGLNDQILLDQSSTQNNFKPQTKADLKVETIKSMLQKEMYGS